MLQLLLSLALALECASAKRSAVATVTSPALLWSNQKYVFDNREQTDLVFFDEVMQRLQEGIETGQSYANKGDEPAPFYLIVYPTEVSTQDFVRSDVDEEVGLDLLRQGSFLFYPYTLRRSHSPASEDWLDIIYTLPENENREDKRLAYLKPGISESASRNQHSISVPFGQDDTLDSIKENLDGAFMIWMEPRSDRPLDDLKTFISNSSERVFVILGTADSADDRMYPATLSGKGLVAEPGMPSRNEQALRNDERSDSVAGPLSGQRRGLLRGRAAPKAEMAGAEMAGAEMAGAEVAGVTGGVPVVQRTYTAGEFVQRVGLSGEFVQRVGLSGSRRRLQEDDGEVVLRMKPSQLSVFLFMGGFVAMLLVGVLCTAEITTPGLLLDKPQVINKEF